MFVIELKAKEPILVIIKIFLKNSPIRLIHLEADKWTLVFSNGLEKSAKLLGEGFRNRWFLCLNFQTVADKKSHFIAISRFFYPKSVCQKLSAYLWSYVSNLPE